jgi:ornithine carbamoyltransferase
MYEGIEYRGYEQSKVEELARHAGVPVWNGLTNEDHPTQMLADLLTIKEQFGRTKGIRLTYMGDARYNMGNSLMIACSKMGMHFTACAPKGYFPNDELVKKCLTFAEESGGSVRLEEDVAKAVTGSDVIYTDVWVSMGEPEELWKERIELMLPYQVNRKVMDMAAKNAIFMHDLPSFHDCETEIGKAIYEKYGLTEMEVTNEVFEAYADVIFRESENRMHTIKAVMAATLTI